MANFVLDYSGQQVNTKLAKAENIDNKITSLSNSSTDTQYPSAKLVYDYIHNDYYFAIPKTVYIKLNTEMKMYFRNMITENYLVDWGSYSNATDIRAYDDYIALTGTNATSKNINYNIYDRFMHKIDSGQITLKINSTPPASQKMLMIGDSFITQGYILGDLKNLFTADGNTLTLIGTKTTSSNNHEGYAGYKYTDFVSGDRASSTPFWDGNAFNFSYFMNQNNYSNLDSVYIQLGTNDCSATTVNQDISNVINAATTIINSILAYDSNIKIYLGLTVMPTLQSDKFANKYNGTGTSWCMRLNMQKLNKAIIDTFSNNSSIKIIANNLILDSAEDISDNVHPTSVGYQKIANQLYYTMMS